MQIVELGLAGLKLIRPEVHVDHRGFVIETYNAPRYEAHGIDCRFVQDNHSRSLKGTLRGLHYQTPGQAKLVRATRGRVFDVAVDIRPDSPTFGRWEGIELDDHDHLQLFIPAGFAHGFCVLSEVADVSYKLSRVYDPKAERALAYDDPELAIVWPLAEPRVSERDAAAPPLSILRRTSP
jgi:dTDP-4-dehydrorhamnose 3,5-epimerase